MGVAAVLATHQRDAPAVVLVEHRVVEQNVAPPAEHRLRAHLLPELTGRETPGFEKVAHVVMREPIQVVGQVRARIVAVAAHQKLPAEPYDYFYGFSF